MEVDFRNVLGYRIGDLGNTHPRSFRCSLKKDDRPMKKRLILTKVNCMDLKSYNMKIEEADTFIRFNHHPNITTLYSYWVANGDDPMYYKSIYMLFEEATVGDLNRCLVSNPLKPSRTTVTKYICGLAKGLGMLHQSGVVHGAVRATNLFINEENHLVLGPIKKSETENLKEMTHLISKFNIAKYIKLYFIYWAPEVFKDDPITIKSDVWSVGIIIYILLTGESPFDLKKEESLISNIREANINWRPLIDHPKILNLLRNILIVDPVQRWPVEKVLVYCQEEFIIIIQRNFRGYMERKHIRMIMRSVKKIQASVKGWLVRRLYQRKRFEVRWQAAKLIQKKWKDFKGNEVLRNIKKLIQMLQAKVLARQVRRAYLKLKKDTVTVQS